MSLLLLFGNSTPRAELVATSTLTVTATVTAIGGATLNGTATLTAVGISSVVEGFGFVII